jgi:Uma2 family endonuclease
VRRHLIASSELEQMVRAWILAEDDRVELIDGELIKMGPIGKSHAACVDRLTRFFNRAADETVLVRTQGPVLINDLVELQPDLALLKARADYYEESLPTVGDILMVIEVADTTVTSDRRVKMPLYAQAGIPVAWLVDLPKRAAEVYTEPRDGVYETVQRLSRKGVIGIAVPGISEAELRVDQFL